MTQTDFNTALKPLVLPAPSGPDISPSFHAAECKWAYLNAPRRSSPEMERGTAIHTMISRNAPAWFDDQEDLDLDGFDAEDAEELTRIVATVRRTFQGLDPSMVYFEGIGQEAEFLRELDWQKKGRLLAVEKTEKFNLRYAMDSLILAERPKILDWKSGRTDGKKKQLEAMAWALQRRLGVEHVDGEFVYVDRGFSDPFTFGPEDWDRIEKELCETATIKLMGKNAPRQINQWCKTCGSVGECPLMRRIDFCVPEILPPTKIEEVENIGIGILRLKDHIAAATEVAEAMTGMFFDFLIGLEVDKEGPKKWEFGNLRASKSAGRYETDQAGIAALLMEQFGRLDCVKLGKNLVPADKIEILIEAITDAGLNPWEVLQFDFDKLARSSKVLKGELENFRKVSSWTHRLTAHGEPEVKTIDIATLPAATLEAPKEEPKPKRTRAKKDAPVLAHPSVTAEEAPSGE